MMFIAILSAAVVFADRPAAADPRANTRIERAKGLIGQMAAGQFQPAVEHFDPIMKLLVPPETLRGVWQRQIDTLGAFRNTTKVRTEASGAYQMVFVTTNFAKGTFDAKVVFGSDNKISGLFFVPNARYRRPPYVDRSRFDEINVTVGKGMWSLPGTLTAPKGSGPGPFPAVVLVHGSGPQDRDESIGPHKPFRDLAEGLASRGIAVLRYEKRTKEHAVAMLILSKITVKEETVDDASAAVDALAADPRIDPKRIFVLGHSLGGMLLPRIAAANARIAGLIGLAGSTRPLEDVVLEQLKYLASLEGKLDDEKRKKFEELEQQIARLKSADLSRADSSGGRALPLGLPRAYWLDLRGYDPAASARKIKKPFLILQGERDYQVTMEDFANWKQALAGRPDVKFISYKNLNHLFSEGRGKSVPAEYFAAGNVAEAVVADIAAWVGERAQNGNRSRPVDLQKLPARLRIALANTQPLVYPRGRRLPLYVLPISGLLRGLDDATSEQALRELDRRGIAYSVDWHPGDRERSLAEGLRIAVLQKKLGLGINVNASACLHSFFNGDERTAHIDDHGKPFFDTSFDAGVKIGCPFAVEFRYPAIKEQVETFVRGYAEKKLSIDFIFADWEIDGPIEWNGAWEASKRCRRCREHIQHLEDFRTFQKSLRTIRGEMQRAAFASTVTRYFPKAMVGNYGVYPDDGYRYWYDYFEVTVPGAPAKSDQKARYREWFAEFQLSGYTCGIPVVYTWYPIFGWYDFADTDYRWFYNMLLVASTIRPHAKAGLPLISFVHWTTTAPPSRPNANVKQMSAEKYQELLRHMLLRGHDALFLWCQESELGREIRLAHEVYADALQYREFLERGEPVRFEVPQRPGPVVSGLRLGNRVLVRRTDFADTGDPAAANRAVTLPVRDRWLSVPPGEGRWQVIEMKSR